MKELLNIVNEQDEVIGEKDRVEIHKSGWLHREVHVYFVTPNREMIFQHRAKDKDTFPDLLNATVGGHVEIGQNYEETALKETEEETGMKIAVSDLIFIRKRQKWSESPATGNVNHNFLVQYLYIYRGDIKDLKIEAGKAIGFEAMAIEKLSGLSKAEQARFIPFVFEFTSTELAEFIKDLKL
ncbi:MAG TPA: NUDIX domain-containing protein [bacterium]|nr:NUDIX domain-containing protein [bacterium]